MNTIQSKFVSAICTLVVDVAKTRAQFVSFGAQLQVVISQLYATIKSDDEFISLFGNGIKGKENVPGEIAEEVRAHVAKKRDATQQGALDTLKTRLSEARQCWRAGIVLNLNESVQDARKRIPKKAGTAQVAPKGETETISTIGWAIPKNAELADVVEQFSLWCAQHSGSSRAVAQAVADFLPVSVNRTRKVG